jgi:hypothetical protein
LPYDVHNLSFKGRLNIPVNDKEATIFFFVPADGVLAVPLLLNLVLPIPPLSPFFLF